MEINDNLSFSFKDRYNLYPTIIIGGSKEILEFTFRDKNGDLLDITGAKVLWTLSEFGSADVTLLSKHGTLSSDYSSIITINANDTRDLEGKFVQQITLTNFLDEDYVPCQGTIMICRNNNNNY